MVLSMPVDQDCQAAMVILMGPEVVLATPKISASSWFVGTIQYNFGSIKSAKVGM